MKPPAPTSNPAFTKVPYSVLLADDHSVVRMGLMDILGSTGHNIQFGEAPNGGAVISSLKARHFDLLVLDIGMRGSESFSLVYYIRREFPLLKVLIFTASSEGIFATRLLRSGVHGYLLKQAAHSEIVDAFRTIREGGVYISDPLSRLIAGHAFGEGDCSPFELLTDREFEVVLKIIKGHSAEDIADMLHINKSTMGTHKWRIMKKLKVKSTVDLMELARVSGII